MGGVFINYRTGDGEFAATLITRVLSSRFGAEHVFLASRSIRPGEDFARKILERLEQSDVLLAIIGARWQTITERQRRRETEAPDDWVHREIAEAFRHGLRVIPVFLDHAVALAEVDLPADIAPLARCQFLRLSHRNDTRDLARLMEELGDLVPDLLLDRVFAASPPPNRALEPVAWLRPGYRIVPFAGRDGELAVLSRWLAGPRQVSAQLVTGPAGLGKTRLAQQLCQDVAGQGWVTGLVHDNATIADLTNLGAIDKPLLVVVDDAETRFEEVHALAAALSARAATAPPARLLLLGREGGDWLTRLRTHTNDRVSSLFRALHDLALGPAELDRGAEFHRAASAYADFLDLPATTLRPPADLAHHRYAAARTVHATALIALLDAHPGSAPAPDPELHRTARPESPYRGLRPFQERDARFFRGRDPQIRQLETLLEQHRLVMVTGASGSGKSSLVRAGLLPSLRERDISVTVLRPTADTTPAELLANAVTPLVGHERARGDLAPLADAIVEAVGHWVLFVDQFEELVAASPDSATELAELVAGLVRAAQARPAGTPPLRAVFTGLAADERSHPLPLPRMGPAELRAAIVGPADLVSFEPGLVDRIIADTTDAPGRLPVVELTLTRLWESAQGGTLTHRAYDEQGGVAGALAAHADRLCTRQLAPDELAVAERLLVQLARPGEHGTFIDTPVRLDQLDPDARDMARTLAEHHLVVLGIEPGGPETVALAHEALVQRWRQLREWLVAAQDFRSWQEQLRTTLGQWRQSGRDPSTLLRGVPLATAENWLAHHPRGLTGEERDYVLASRVRQRRGVLGWRIVTAVISALALTATALAVLAANRNQQLAEQLRHAVAVSLGQEAERRSDTDPFAALQFAQAAWRHDPTRPEAYAALLRQYLGFAAVDEIRSGLWSGAVTAAVSTEDGRVSAIAEEDGRITVWTGLFGPTPHSWFVATIPGQRGLLLSPDGRWLAVATDHGGVTLWDVDQGLGPLPLRLDETRVFEAYSVRSARFSPDGGVLVVTLLRNAYATTPGAPYLVEVWDVPLRQQITSGVGAAPGVTDVHVRRTEPGGGRAWFGEDHADGTRHEVLRDLSTGAALGETAADFVTPDGVFADCGPQLAVLDPATGAPKRTTRVLDCPSDDGGLTDLSGRYALSGSPSAQESFARRGLVDLGTGRSYLVDAPPEGHEYPVNNLTGHRTETTVAIPDAGTGPPTVFVLSTGMLLRLAPPRSVDDATVAALSQDLAATALSPDGRVLVALTGAGPDFGILAVDVRTGRRVEGTADNLPTLGANPRIAFSLDGKRLFVAGNAGELTTLLAADLTVVRTVYAGAPTLPDTHASIVPLPGDKVAVLYAGDVTTWRISTGEHVGEMTSLADGISVEDDPRAERHPVAVRWPIRPARLLVATTAGVELWDLDDHRVVWESLGGSGVAAPDILADPARSRVAVHYLTPGRLELWDPDGEGTRPRLASLPGTHSMVTFTRDGKLVTTSDAGLLHVWDSEVLGRIASFRVPGVPTTWSTHDDTLTTLTRQGPLTVDLEPRHWIEHLCHLNDRDYTPGERAALPGGADPVPPCSATR
ncbi:AAA family ATPase [Actinophytocola oryzae]|uniref:AAA ATPase-like protein n=1 Tax=Actinophytocola oryzae TaxID=502181 RepID=A0A4R7V1I9_9PSEU|nr:AAA family ATPase [Actinophytocola oryzae]TDV43163.1 AAA ATPase-like protein [Actinophytocola oryzae]